VRFRFYKASKILVFKTDIKDHEKVKLIQSLFNNQHAILEWSVDIQDVDKVLRLETTAAMNESRVIDLMSSAGIACMVMTW
jgi:hypothetical protein